MRQFLLAMLLTIAPSGGAHAMSPEALAIEKTYNAWVAATNEKDIEEWSAFLAPNALFLPPDSVALHTEQEIRQYYSNLFSDPNFLLDCRQIEAEISVSGEMAWARGECHATFTGADGEVSDGDSKWTKVWVKQSDGRWKCRLNTWNAAPAEGP